MYPASIGSKEKPAPSGDYTVRAVAEDPTYTYNPDYGFKGVKAEKKFVIKPGPNNPVGSVWIDLSVIFRNSRHSRTRKGRKDLFAWLRPIDELGC